MSYKFTFIILLFISTLSHATQPVLNIDENAIYAEIDALVDKSSGVSEKDLQSSVQLIHKGISHHDKGDFIQAIKYYDKALKKDPLSASAYYEKSMSYYALQDYEQAYINAIKTLAIYPGAEEAYIMKANILDDTGKPYAAIEAYDKLIEVNPNSFMALLNKGITALKIKKYTIAETAFVRANKLDANHPSPYYFLFLTSYFQGYNYDEEKYIAKFLNVAEDKNRIRNAQARQEEIKRETFFIDVTQKSKVILLSQMKRAIWRESLHRENYPSERGYKPSIQEEVDIANTLLTYWNESGDDVKNKTDLLILEELKQLKDFGFLEAKAYVDLEQQLGEDDLIWGANNFDAIKQYRAWNQNKNAIALESH